MLFRAASSDPGVRVLRVGVAVLLFIHGVFRLMGGGVAPFGEFLTASGIPFGTAVAWILTAVEIIATPLLAAGVLVIPISVWMFVELAAGIALVHAREGWFVVGGGRNGVEYSVLLMISLVAICVSEWWWQKRSAAT